MELSYYIFGAHSRGRTLAEYLRVLEPESRMLGFMYDNDELNPAEADGYPILKIGLHNYNRTKQTDQDKSSYINGSSESSDTEEETANQGVENLINVSARVYIATRGEYHDSIVKRIRALGFNDIVCVTPELDIILRGKYIEYKFHESNRKLVKLKPGQRGSGFGSYADICVYIAKSHMDRDFNSPVELLDFEHIIQSGCALTDIRLEEADFFDNAEGDDNISLQNRMFCELTAMYWIWKHSDFEIVGLEHWRRRFILPDNWPEFLNSGLNKPKYSADSPDEINEDKIDVILPVPLCVMPSLEANYKSRHLPYIWDELMKILREVHPEDYDSARSFFNDNSLYSPCNMLISRREVFNAYCEWLFPVILKLGDRIGTIEDSYQNRYPGFVAERLLTYYFESRRDHLNIAYADKSFLS